MKNKTPTPKIDKNTYVTLAVIFLAYGLFTLFVLKITAGLVFCICAISFFWLANREDKN